jgi:hypothetical protein
MKKKLILIDPQRFSSRMREYRGHSCMNTVVNGCSIQVFQMCFTWVDVPSVVTTNDCRCLLAQRRTRHLMAIWRSYTILSAKFWAFAALKMGGAGSVHVLPQCTEEVMCGWQVESKAQGALRQWCNFVFIKWVWQRTCRPINIRNVHAFGSTWFPSPDFGESSHQLVSIKRCIFYTLSSDMSVIKLNVSCQPKPAIVVHVFDK